MPSECKICLAVHHNSLITLPYPSRQDSDFAAAASAPNLSAAAFAGAQSSDNHGRNSHKTRTPFLKGTGTTQCTSTAFTAEGHAQLDYSLMPTTSPMSVPMLCNGKGVESQTGNRLNIFCTSPGVTSLLRVVLRSEIASATLTWGFSSEEGNN